MLRQISANKPAETGHILKRQTPFFCSGLTFGWFKAKGIFQNLLEADFAGYVWGRKRTRCLPKFKVGGSCI